jgi:oligopeptide transport system permease protein
MKRTFHLIISGLLTMFAISVLTFILIRLVPGGPFTSDRKLPPEVEARMMEKFKLNLPWHEQYIDYMTGVVTRFDFGPSTRNLDSTVSEIIFNHIGVSMELGLYALTIAITLGIVMGILAAAFRGTWVDFSSMFVAIAGVSLPSFLVATVAILIFAVELKWVQATFLDYDPYRFVLPSIILGLRPAAIIARLTRSSVLEVLYLDFVRTARAKGLWPSRILFVHVLRNAMVPIITILGPLTAQILTGSFVIEKFFSISGIADNFIASVSNRDYPLVMGMTLVFSFFLIGFNTLVEIAYGIIDPRMRKA